MRLVLVHLRCRWCVVIIALIVFLSRHTTADPSSAPVKVSWPEIVRLVDQHPLLAAGTYMINAAQSGVGAAGTAPNPTLEGTVGQGRERNGDGVGVQWGLSLSVPLGWIAQRRSMIDAAEAEVEVAKAEREALRREILLELRVLFWSVAYEQTRVASLSQLESQTEALVQKVKRRVEKGEARPVEATRIEIELEKVISELESARISLSARRAALALWLHTTSGESVIVVADLNAIPTAADLQGALEKTRETHPNVLVARARMNALAAEVKTEKRARAPSFSLTGFADVELDQWGYGAGVAIDLPLWNWNADRIAQAKASLAAGQKQAEAATLEIEATVIDAQAACSASVATATRFRDKVIPLSEIAASTTDKTYQLGEASILDVIDARRTLLDAHHLYLSALAQAHIDCSRLGVMVGEEPK